MFYETVKGLCDDNHIRITALARRLNLSPSAPNNWKEGSLPKVETVMKIAEFFDVTTDHLLYGKDHKPAANTLGDVTSSAVAQGNNNSHVTISNGASSNDLQEFDLELLRVVRSLDMRNKLKLMQSAYALEEAQAETKEA